MRRNGKAAPPDSPQWRRPTSERRKGVEMPILVKHGRRGRVVFEGNPPLASAGPTFVVECGCDHKGMIFQWQKTPRNSR
jgi:hypothetical protein